MNILTAATNATMINMGTLSSFAVYKFITRQVALHKSMTIF